MEGDREEIDDRLSDGEDKEGTEERHEFEDRMQRMRMMREPGKHE
jgi:hypothetical protein